MNTLTLATDATLEGIKRLQAELAAFGEARNWPGKLAYQVELVIEELCLNIVKHGNAHRIELSLRSNPDALAIDIVDDGIAFDPLTEVPTPDLASGVEDRPVGGLGVFLVKSVIDCVEYTREDDRNHIKLEKRRDG